MRDRDITGKVIDEIIRFGATGATLAASAIAPSMLLVLHKPLLKLYGQLDEKERKREVMRVVYYMKARGYLAGDYEYGLQITDKARKRLLKTDIAKLRVTPQHVWDKRWRIIIYDIPEKSKGARDALTTHLRSFGCFQLQKSTWITPFPCRDSIEVLTSHYGVDEYVTYFEAINLDNERVLIARFKRKYKATKF